MSSGSGGPFPDHNPSDPGRGSDPARSLPARSSREPPPMPPRPTPPADDDVAARRRGCLAMVLAGLLVLMALVGLAFLSQGYMIPVVLVAGALFAYVFFHYVVWGWWLGNIIREEARQEEEARQAMKQAENLPR